MIEDMADAIEMMASGTYSVTRLPASVYVAGKKVEPLLATSWANASVYALAARGGNSSQVYEATTGGTSAALPATGPSGTGAGIADGTVVWKWVAPRISTLSISASVQPLSGREVDRLPEGMRSKELLALFSETELKTAIAGVGEPDSIVVDGDTYEIQMVERWDKLGNYFRAILAKVGR